MKRITWLASYPKSGNTWLRVFLTALNDRSRHVELDDLAHVPVAASRELFDDHAGLSSADLRMDEIERLRPEVYEQAAARAHRPLFMKVHDARTSAATEGTLFPAVCSTGAIYIVRNPLDVAASFAHHLGVTPEVAIDHMADDSFAFCIRRDRLHEQLPQRLRSWSSHVLSWADGAPFPVHLVRYEDMKADPVATFGDAADFLGLGNDRAAVAAAVARSHFGVLQRQEQARGFKERSSKATAFFRKGEVGSWRQELSLRQVRRLIRDHGPVMRRFGYTTDLAELVG
jgi:aryl sulfotransferase